jgi:hypothetical protein
VQNKPNIEHCPTFVEPKSFSQTAQSVGGSDQDERRPEERMSQRDLGPGETQALLQNIELGPAACSDLVQLDQRTVGCLYEAGEKSPYEGIFFKAVSISR